MLQIIILTYFIPSDFCFDLNYLFFIVFLMIPILLLNSEEFFLIMYIALTGSENNKDVYIYHSFRKENGKSSYRYEMKNGYRTHVYWVVAIFYLFNCQRWDYIISA